MDQGRVVKKVLRDMRDRGLIDQRASGEIEIYLEAVFVAGWEDGRSVLTAHNKKRVIMYDRKLIKLAEFGSVVEASKKTRNSAGKIYSAIERGRPTKRGHIWKYENE